MGEAAIRPRQRMRFSLRDKRFRGLVWQVLLNGLPSARHAVRPIPAAYLSNRGLIIPTIDWTDARLLIFLALVVGGGGAFLNGRWATSKQMRHGRWRGIWPVALLLIFG